MLDDEEVGGRVRGGDFECERTEAERVEMAGTVLAGADGMEFGGRGWGGGLGDKIVQSGGGRDRGDGFEEGAALEGHWLMVRGKLGDVKRLIGNGRVGGNTLGTVSFTV